MKVSGYFQSSVTVTQGEKSPPLPIVYANGRASETLDVLAPPGMESRFPGYPDHSLVIRVTMLSRPFIGLQFMQLKQCYIWNVLLTVMQCESVSSSVPNTVDEYTSSIADTHIMFVRA